MITRGAYCFMIQLLMASVDALIKPAYEDDPELYQVWTTPKEEKEYYSYTSGAKWVGNLFAGRAEFPYLVDIREAELDQEKWSSGTLLSAWYVLTTCRSVKEYQIHAVNHGEGGDLESVLEARLRVNLKISFAPTYLWENYNTSYYKDYRPVEANPVDENNIWIFATELVLKPPVAFDAVVVNGAFKSSPVLLPRSRAGNYLDSGTRTVKDILLHPDCGLMLCGDLAVIQMSRAIYPIIPIVNYLPILMTRTGDAPDDPVMIADVNLAEQLAQRRICYIGAYGRDWRNWHNHIVNDYKVRYRVYYEEMQTCYNAMSKFQRDAEQGFHKDYPKYPPMFEVTPRTDIEKDLENTMCFTTRARVGTVCDHDRGAPLVCDGYVRGFLVRGAWWAYCNNLLPMPFIVVKAKAASNYYYDAIRALNTKTTSKNKKSRSYRVLLDRRLLYLNTNFIIFFLMKTQFSINEWF